MGMRKQGSECRRIRVVVAMVASLVVAGSRAASPPTVVGLWGWHAKWESPPAEVVKEINPIWSAPGVLVNFCPGGRLRIANGVFYRSTGYASLGSSDGLSLYEGQWSWKNGTITVTYKLVDAEIALPGTDLAMRKELVEHPRIEGDALLFAFRYVGELKPAELQFRRATIASDVLEDRFVECDAKSRK